MSFSRAKIWVFMTGIALLVLVLAGNAPGQAGDKPQMVLKLAENQPEDYPTTIGDKEFARLVEERTNGRIKIEVYAGGQLGDEKSVIESVQMGAVDFARVNTQPMGEFSKGMKVLSLPYLFRNENHLWKVLNGPIGEKLLDDLSSSQIVGLAYYDSGARNFYNSKRPVKTPADLKGLRIRVQQAALMVDLVQALGASATPMAYGEVYTGLQTGVIDGAENNWPSYYSTSHYEVAKYYTIDEHTRNPEVLIASRARWDKLSEKDQQIIKKAAKDSVAVQRKSWKEWENKAIKAVKEKGNVITTIKDLTPWQEAVKPLYDKHGADFKDLIARIKAEK